VTDRRNREKALERLLTRAFAEPSGQAGSGPTVPATSCADPETLAAYFDRVMQGAEKAAWESHFSVCPRCRHQLVALARAEAAVAAAEKQRARPAAGWWPWSVPLRWLAPAAAALAVFAVWVVVRMLAPPPDRQWAEVQIARQTPPAPPTTAPQKTEPAMEKALRDRMRDLEPSIGGVKKDRPMRTGGLMAKPPKSTLGEPRPARLPAATPAPAVALAAVPAASEKEEGRPKVAASQGLGIRETVPQQEAAPRKMPAPSERPATVEPLAQAEKRSERDARLAASGPVRPGLDTPRDTERKPSALRSRQASTGPVAAFRAGVERQVIASPGAKVLWRAGPAGHIERSIDGGKTWQPQDAGITADLLAGSAPSESVCWVVGRAGTVLRTVDGEKWERLVAPTEMDLVAVAASDALSAKVVSADGQSFVTSDGGRTWRRL